MNHSSASSWFFYLGVLFFLIGLYGAARIAFNTLVLPQYPTDGAIPSNLFATNSFTYGYQRESDCQPYPQSYYDPITNAPRPATAEEKRNEELNTQRCLQGIAEERQRVKNVDMGTTAFFLTIGLGLLVATKSRRFS